jgi:hypothetical protein
MRVLTSVTGDITAADMARAMPDVTESSQQQVQVQVSQELVTTVTCIA